MVDGTPFARVAHGLSSGSVDVAGIAGALNDVLDVTTVSVSTLGEAFGAETVSISDADAVRLSELQIDLGEGPLWQAHGSRERVSCPLLDDTTGHAWPLASHALRELGVAAVHAFPLRVGTIDIGAIGLYSTTPRTLTSSQARDAHALAAIVSRRLLREVVLSAERTEGPGRPSGDYTRREVHQATGMVLSQLGISADDAFVVLRGHAFATGRPVRDVAADVIARTLSFTPDPIEGT